MADVELLLGDASIELHPRTLRARERLGESTSIDLEALATTPVEPAALVGQDAIVLVRGAHGERMLRGVILRATAFATSDATSGRRYRLEVRSRLEVLSLSRRTRVFQHLSVPEIVKKVLERGGYGADQIACHLTEEHAPREYTVQYAETDASFVRRLCEEEGLYFRFEGAEESERFVLEDDSTTAPAALPETIALADSSDLKAPGPVAFGWRVTRRVRPGKVTLRDYKPSTPAVDLEARGEAGTELEKGVEVYEAPGRFAEPDEGSVRAARRLESLRADARGCSFETTAFVAAPGLMVELEPTSESDASAPSGKFFVIEVRHAWDGTRYDFRVEAAPSDLRFRLPRRTPRPRVQGLHHAFVATASGEEIHVDKDGCVRLHFPWDREGPTDETSSLPVRVVQPNTPGSMLLPRGGWEVLVAFEDGDPDRPYVVGRAFNAKAPPPYSLPGNKTMTSLGTVSSPGGAKENRININDAAGSENLAFLAGFGKATSVANNMMVQTAKNEDLTVTASQVRVVGGKDAISVTQAFRNTLGSQSATVGGMQKVHVKGDLTVGVGPETVMIGAACLEKVGNPVSGLKNLARSAALQGAGALGVPVGTIMQGAAVLQAGMRGYQRGGFRGALGAAGGAAAGQALGAAAGLLGGGEALVGALGGGAVGPWVERKLNPGAAASGGGASGGTNAAAAQGPGPGHRNTIVAGACTELVGASCSATSPGMVGWTTIGPSTFLVSGSHRVRASTTGSRTLGAQTEVLGSLSIKTTSDITRQIKGVLTTTVGGSLQSDAGGEHSIKAGAALRINVGGALTMDGGTIAFICGSSKLVASPGGVIIDSPSVTITGHTKQAGIHHK